MASETEAATRELLKELHMCRCDVDARFVDLRKQEATLSAAASSLAGLEATLSVLSATSSHASSGSGDTSLGGQSTGVENVPLEVFSDLHNSGRALHSEENFKARRPDNPTSCIHLHEWRTFPACRSCELLKVGKSCRCRHNRSCACRWQQRREGRRWTELHS